MSENERKTWKEKINQGKTLQFSYVPDKKVLLHHVKPTSKRHQTSKVLCLDLKKGNHIITSIPLTLIKIFATE